jgi:hypothetical protein
MHLKINRREEWNNTLVLIIVFTLQTNSTKQTPTWEFSSWYAVNKCPAFYVTSSFINMFTAFQHSFLHWASLLQSNLHLIS